MATTDAPTPTPAPTPAAGSGTSIAAAPTSGITTSEGVMTLIVTLLAAVQANPWIGSMPAIYKVISSALAVLAVLGYQAQRTSLKKAHLAASTNMQIATSPIGALSKGISAVAMLGIVGIILGSIACGGASSSSGLSNVEAGLGSAGSGFINCEDVDLNADVGTTGLSVLATIGADLLSANWAGALAEAISFLGEQQVACAVIAINDFGNQLGKSGSASTGALTLTSAQIASSNAAAAIAKYGWKKAPKQAKAIRKSSMIDNGTRGGAHETVGMDGSTWRKQHAGSASPAAVATGSAK